MMNIAELERRYKILLRDFRTGQIDQATLVSKLDELQFQDQWGRYWMIGSETGAWYYYDGRNWQPANPQQAEQLPFIDDQGYYWKQGHSSEWYYYQPETGRWLEAKPAGGPQSIARSRPQKPATSPELTQSYETRPAMPQKMLFAALVAGMLLLILLVLPLGGSPAAGGPRLAPSPRPPLDTGTSGGGSSSGSNDSDGSNGEGGTLHSAIYGTLLDLSTNQPGTGIDISVNGSIVRTDSDGSFSITGLSAGEYYVLPELGGQGTLTQGPRYVSLDGRNNVTVDLTYRSRSEPLPTDTPQPVAVSVATPPENLPNSGAVVAVRPVIIGSLGLLLIIMGGLLHFGDAKTRR